MLYVACFFPGVGSPRQGLLSARTNRNGRQDIAAAVGIWRSRDLIATLHPA